MAASLEIRSEAGQESCVGIAAHLRAFADFPVVLATALAVIVFLFANRDIGDPDIWWHLRNAEQLVRTGNFVRSDSYSFTVSGVPWINHEWLGELPYYFAYRCLGVRGLFLIFLGAVEVIFLTLFRFAARISNDYWAAFLASSLAVPLATVSFGPRTLLFGWIFLVLELHVLERFYVDKPGIWALPILFVVWVNTHGSWLIGIVVLALFVGSGIAPSFELVTTMRWTRSEAKRLAGVIGLSVCALFLNPYGWKLVAYPFNLAFQQKLNIAYVQEWQTPDLHGLRGKLLLAIALGLMLLSFVRGISWRLYDLLLVALALYAAFTYNRFLFLAAILLVPSLAVQFRGVGAAIGHAKKRPFLNVAIIATEALLITASIPNNTTLVERMSRDYPIEATSYLQTLQPDGRVLNDYDWGGYLAWNARQIPVFVDSRVDIFEYAGVFRDYLDIRASRTLSRYCESTTSNMYCFDVMRR